MQVVRLDPIAVAYPEPNDAGAVRRLLLVRAETDDGTVGWGEAVTMWPEATAATGALVDGMAELVIGRDPVHTTAIWRDLVRHAWWYGHGGGLAWFAIAAIDLAMWDLAGKALGRNVVDLLGGPAHQRLPAVASAHAFKADIDDIAADVADWRRAGLRGVKFGFGKRGDAGLGVDHDRDVAFVAAVGQAMAPHPVMVDLGIAVTWDLATALRRAAAFEELGVVDWLEEPLGAWDPHGYAALRHATRLRIAYGEREWTDDAYQRVLDTGTVDVVGVDPGRVGGLTGFQRVAARVEAAGRQLNAHAWSSAIVTAASLAASLASPAARVLEVKPLANPMQDELVTHPVRHREGWFTPLESPGLGIEVREDVVAAYREVTSTPL